jgi:hypothetical protein
MTLEAALAEAVGNAVRKVVRGEVVLRASPAFDAQQTPLGSATDVRRTRRLCIAFDRGLHGQR